MFQKNFLLEYDVIRSVSFDVWVYLAMICVIFVQDLSKRAYPDVCSMVADESLLPCLVDLCKALWLLMRSYKQVTQTRL